MKIVQVISSSEWWWVIHSIMSALQPQVCLRSMLCWLIQITEQHVNNLGLTQVSQLCVHSVHENMFCQNVLRSHWILYENWLPRWVATSDICIFCQLCLTGWRVFAYTVFIFPFVLKGNQVMTKSSYLWSWSCDFLCMLAIQPAVLYIQWGY